MEAPDWLRVDKRLPAEISSSPPNAPDRPKVEALIFTQFRTFFPRLIEMVHAGWTVTKAIKSLPTDPPLDAGAFVKWIHKDPERVEQLRLAKIVRTETYTGRMIELAEGEEENPTAIDRARLAIDTYKWLVSRENRKEYGETKTIEMNTTISITAALADAEQRVIDVKALAADEDEDEDDKMLRAPEEQEDGEDY